MSASIETAADPDVPGTVHGAADDPLVLLLGADAHTPGLVRALVDAGRRVLVLPPELDNTARLRELIGGLSTRPAVVALGGAGWVAIDALGAEATTLASGLIAVDPGPAPAAPAAPADAVAGAPASGAVPALIVAADTAAAGQIAAQLPGAEAIGVEPGPDRDEVVSALIIDFLERRHPRAPAEFRSGSDARTLRDALGCFATGVTIVTARDAGGAPVGLTANSFTSLSLDPPLLLVCIANGSGSAATLRGAAHFAVNVLQIGQQPVSSRFATQGADRFAHTDWVPGETGVPLIAGSLAAFVCAREAVHAGGDHFILVGRVARARFEPHRDPLLYFRGRYRRLHFA